MTDLVLVPAQTALVVIDLQAGILARQSAPHSARDVLARCAELCERFRRAGGPVVLVRVSFASSFADALSQSTDAGPMGAAPPAGWDVLAPELARDERDIIITKHQWGAFYGTELDLQLRRRGISTIVLAGIATNFGVESTARDAYERGYALVFAEDAMTGLEAHAHEFAVRMIFPRLGRVRSTRDVLAALP